MDVVEAIITIERLMGLYRHECEIVDRALVLMVEKVNSGSVEPNLVYGFIEMELEQWEKKGAEA